MAGQAKKGDSASTKSSSKSFKSLRTAATSTLKNIKRKAVNILSPKRKKKSKTSTNTPEDSDDSSIAAEAPVSHRHTPADVIDLEDDTSHHGKAGSNANDAESSEAELGQWSSCHFVNIILTKKS